MEKVGTSIIFINDLNQVLFFLRDDIPNIKYPNMWDILGGNLEEGESPRECIIREMEEELELKLSSFELFEEHLFEDRLEFTFWQRLNIDTKTQVLNEGQKLKWFTKEEALSIDLAFNFNQTIERFFKEEPFKG